MLARALTAFAPRLASLAPWADSFDVRAGRAFREVLLQFVLFQILFGLFGAFDDGTERRIGEDQIEFAAFQRIFLGFNVVEEVKGIVADNVRVSVVVNDHVHFGDAGEFFVDFDTEEVLFGEVVPVGKVFAALAGVRAVFWKTTIGLTSDVVEGIEQEAAGPASRVEDELLAFGVQDFDCEGDEFARGEILSEIALEESAHKLLERDALGVEFGLVQRDAFEMLHTLRKDRRLDVDFVGENVGLKVLLSFVELVDALGQFFGTFAVATLEVVGLAILAVGVLFVAMLNENDLAKLAEGGDGTATAPFPKRLMALANGRAEFFAAPRTGLCR